MRSTLNLLPSEKRAALRLQFIASYAETMLFIFFVVAVFAAGTLVALRMSLAKTYDDFTRRSDAGAEETQAITDEIKAINGYMQRVNAFEGRFTPWSSVLVKIAALVPAGVRIDSIRVDKGAIAIAGAADTRDDVLLLQQRLRDSGLFTDVQSPLSNILQDRNVHFEFEMRYAPPK